MGHGCLGLLVARVSSFEGHADLIWSWELLPLLSSRSRYTAESVHKVSYRGILNGTAVAEIIFRLTDYHPEEGRGW